MAREKSGKQKKAFTAVLFEGDLMEERMGNATAALASRFGVPVLAVAMIDTEGGGRGEGSAPGASEEQEAARMAAGDLYETVNQEVPPVKSEKDLDTWAVKRARELKKLADGLEKGIIKRNRTTLCDRAMRVRAAAEALVFGVRNWELDDEDKRWQAEHREPKDPEGG